MVLSSQSPRPGMDRLYRVSGRRRGGGGKRWLALLLVIVLVGGLVYALGGFGDGSPESAQADSGGGTNPNTTISRPVESRSTPTIRFESGSGAVATTTRPAQAEVNSATRPGRDPAQADETMTPVGSEELERSAEQLVAQQAQSSRVQAWAKVDASSDASVQRGAELISQGQLVEARRVMSAALYGGDVPAKPIADALRAQLADVNAALVFSDQVAPGDDLAERYRIQSGDYLSRIGPRFDIPYQLIERINGVDANRIRAGQYLKVLRGPLHARVVRSHYVMDVFGKDPQGGAIHVISFPVGLGENDSTPDGMWVVEPGRKVVNPDWRNPRTGEYYQRDDPRNPIGNYWIALEGADANTAGKRGYGIHGTIEPESIGSQASMGCVRLLDEDIKLVYFMLASGESTVEIRE
ncbi:MAG: L,D-transpeptidase family protein [Phycisphaeraceae bacterium]